MQGSVVSIIVPVYKVEQYLDRCVQSIVNQTYKNLEIILVDDGSPDNCPAMCDDWAAKDSRIRVIHKENGGLSSARNAGLEMVTGAFLQFTDSDDWLEPEMIAYLIDLAERNEADVVRCGYFESYETDEPDHPVGESRCVQPDVADQIIDLMNDGYLSGVVWNKLYRRTVVGDVRYDPADGCSEDILYNFRVLSKTQKVIYGDKPLYHYAVRLDSITNNEFKPAAFSIIRAKHIIMEAHKDDEQVEPYCLKGYLNSAMIVMNNMLSSGQCLEYYPGLRAEILKYKWTVWRSSLYRVRDKAKMLLLALSPTFYKKAVTKK
jgi:glycosyltransferase involved in cell wall biosynthesis